LCIDCISILAVGGARLKEASMINKSLLCLGYVINALVDRENGKERHVPFRDSKVRHDICIVLHFNHILQISTHYGSISNFANHDITSLLFF
jgi:hypothetical protein